MVWGEHTHTDKLLDILVLIDQNFRSYRTIPGLGSHSSLRNHFTKTDAWSDICPNIAIHHHSPPFTLPQIPTYGASGTPDASKGARAQHAAAIEVLGGRL